MNLESVDFMWNIFHLDQDNISYMVTSVLRSAFARFTTRLHGGYSGDDPELCF